MAFVTSPNVDIITIGNDVIILPDETLAKQRLALSYAIAQSTVLSIFEARIEKKMEDYKYIPETLAAVGSIHLEQTELGKMIGEIFVVRHDVNLHSDILDTPDFFWEVLIIFFSFAYEICIKKIFSSYLYMQYVYFTSGGQI